MLDVENILYAGVTKLLRERHEGISVYGCEVDSPASFPAVTFVESDNSTYKRSLSGDNIEHNASLMYTVNVYSNLQDALGNSNARTSLPRLTAICLERALFVRQTCRFPTLTKAFRAG